MTHRPSSPPHAGRKAALGLGLVLLAISSATAGQHAPIAWRSSYEQAKAEARSKNLLLWVQFTGPWCHFCQRMESETFVSPAVTSAAHGKFVPVKLRSDIHESLALHFGLSGLPSTIILRPDGKVVARHEGYAAPTVFRAFLVQTLKREGRSNTRVAEQKRSVEPEVQDDVALAGYDPVKLVQDHRLAAGRRDLVVHHDGREYRFASANGREQFLKEPEKFLPACGGRCVVSRVDDDEAVAGNPRFGVLYRGHLYLCSSDEAREQFLAEPEKYASADVAEKGFCPHCRNMRGLLVRGSPKYSATYEGLRYYFPDDEHREAFRADPEKYVR